MNAESLYLAVVLAAALVSFYVQKLRPDVTALLVMLALMLPLCPTSDGMSAILEPGRAFGTGLVDPALDPFGRLRRDQRAHPGLGPPRVTCGQGGGGLRQPRDQLVGDRRLHEQPLHRRAHLASLAERRVGDLRHRTVQVRVGAHDHAGDAAQLELCLAQAGPLLDQAAHPRAAGEGVERYRGLFQKPGADRIAAAVHQRQQLGRQARLEQCLAQECRRQRRQRRRLEHDAVAPGQRRRHLVDHGVER